MTLITALVAWHDRFGAFIALVLLVLQLGSSAGTYPIQLSNQFFRYIHPYLPMSYAVSGFRQTISMSGHISSQVGILLLYLAGGVLFTAIVVTPKLKRLTFLSKTNS